MVKLSVIKGENVVKKLDTLAMMKIRQYFKCKEINRVLFTDLRAIISSPKRKYSEEDIIDYLVNSLISYYESESTLTENDSLKYFLALVGGIAHCHNSLTEEMTSKIQHLKNVYDKYIYEHATKENESVREYWMALTKILQLESKSSAELETDIKEENDSLKEELIELRTANKALKDEVLKLQTSLDKSLKKLKKERTNSLKSEKNNEHLSDAFRKVTSEKANLELLLEEKAAERKELLDNIETLKSEHDSLPYKIGKETLQFKSIDDIILEQIASDGKTLSELEFVLKYQYGMNLSKKEILDSLNRIGSLYNIRQAGNIIELDPQYRVEAPIFKSEQIVNVPTDDKEVIDFLVISDLHSDIIDDNVKMLINASYDYCAREDIKYILNLGDLFHESQKVLTKEDIINSYRLSDKMITDFPLCDTVKHIVLGGNHDKSKLHTGVDHLKYVCDNRSDMVFAGYDSAYLSLGESANKEFIGIHHLMLAREDMEIENPTESARKIINGKCLKKFNNKSKTFIDILGHLHRSLYDHEKGIYFTSSLNHDRCCWGATHVKVYMESDGTIKYVSIIPLVVRNTSLSKVTENVYTRSLKKLRG